ncbi:hypothetical protein GA0061073_1625, partial [Lactobacillus apis]
DNKFKLDMRSARGANVIVNGNGHRIDMGVAYFRLETTDNTFTFVLTDANFTQNVSSYGNALVMCAKYMTTMTDYVPNGTLCFNNITLKTGDINPYDKYGEKTKALYVADAGKATVHFSGTNLFEVNNSFNPIDACTPFSKVEFANDASVTIKTEGGNTVQRGDFCIGASSKLSLGDRSTFTISEDRDQFKVDRGPIAGTLATWKIGNDVTWNQHGWGSFINAGSGDTSGAALGKNNASIKAFFGKRFTLNQDIITEEQVPSISLCNPGTYLAAPQIFFSEGASINIKSNSDYSPIFDLSSAVSLTRYPDLAKYPNQDLENYPKVPNSSNLLYVPTLVINNPRNLNLSYCDEDGDPLTPSAPIIRTARDGKVPGVFILNGVAQPLNLWTSSNVSKTPDNTVNKFDKLQIWNESTTLY